MPERSFSSPSYRYGFNGMEKDEEFTGSQSHYDFGARIYDGRLGRMLSIDPLADHFSYSSPYIYANNSPILFLDLEGLNPYIVFNGKSHLMYIYDDGGTPDIYDDDVQLFVGDAHNEVASSSNGKWEDGKYKMTDTKTRHTHGDAKHSDGKLKDSSNGAYGEGGIYRSKSFKETTTKLTRSGMAIHAGREYKKDFLKRVTMGCIRVKPETMTAIDKAISDHGSLTGIIVQENRTSTNSTVVNQIKPTNAKPQVTTESISKTPIVAMSTYVAPSVSNLDLIPPTDKDISENYDPYDVGEGLFSVSASVVPSKLNLRSGPGTEFTTNGNPLVLGENLKVIGNSKDKPNWIQVETKDGRKGWVSKKYTKIK